MFDLSENMFVWYKKDRKRTHSEAEMRFLIYDLGHKPNSLLEIMTDCRYDSNLVARRLRGTYGINFRKIKKWEVRQYFRMYKLWGLNVSEVRHMLKIKDKSATEWRDFEFEEGEFPRKELYATPKFLRNAVFYGMDSFDYMRLLQMEENARKLRISFAQLNERYLEKLESIGVEPDILVKMHRNYDTPIAFRIDDVVGREHQDGWVEGTYEEF